jgi:hypothetical protein
MINYNHIFDNINQPPIVIPKKPLSSKLDKNSEKTLAMIKYHKYADKSGSQRYSENENSDFCDDEIKRTLAKKNWNGLDRCFKWQFIENYLKTFEWITDKNVFQVKTMFISNTLDAKFDNKKKEITTLNINIEGYDI